jgi:hypothetical protein
MKKEFICITSGSHLEYSRVLNLVTIINSSIKHIYVRTTLLKQYVFLVKFCTELNSITFNVNHKAKYTLMKDS